LPESQLDRFLMRVQMGYPDAASEREILRSNRPLHGGGVDPVASGADIVELQSRVEDVRVDESVVDYLMAIVERTRNHEHLGLGVSPRGSIALFRAAQALALVEGLNYCTPDHVKRLAVPVFAHRSIADTRSNGGDTGDRKVEIVEEILRSIPVPL
jgi:MoxR-like ATPase